MSHTEPDYILRALRFQTRLTCGTRVLSWRRRGFPFPRRGLTAMAHRGERGAANGRNQGTLAAKRHSAAKPQPRQRQRNGSREEAQEAQDDNGTASCHGFHGCPRITGDGKAAGKMHGAAKPQANITLTLSSHLRRSCTIAVQEAQEKNGQRRTGKRTHGKTAGTGLEGGIPPP